MKTRVVLRADGSAIMGFGHIFRLLALAEMLQPEFEVLFITRSAPEGIRKQILRVCKEMVELEAMTGDSLFSHIRKGDIVVLDGYHFTTSDQESIRKVTGRLVCIDDQCQIYFHADIVINHAEGVNPEEYRTDLHTSVYTGTRYALIRKAFLEAARQNRQAPSPSEVFIAFGGTDLFQLPLRSLKICETIPEIKSINLVLGSQSEHEQAILKIAENSAKRIQVHRNLNADGMIDLMKRSGLAFCSASTLSYELSCVGIPMIAVHTVDNQDRLSEFLRTRQLAEIIHFEPMTFDGLMHESMQKIFAGNGVAARQVEQQRTYFDGQSGSRIKTLFENLSHA